MNILNTIRSGFFQLPILLNGFQEIFKRYSRDIQGDVIDFVRLVKGISFKEALAFLSEEPFQKEAVQENRERPFYYPLKRIEDSNCRNFRRNRRKDDPTRFDGTSQLENK